MNISAETVKELRERTGAGMMDCKRALADSNGDVEKALDALRKAGLAKAAKKAVRAAAEGLIGLKDTGKAVIMVDVTCETDFVCKTDEFQKFVPAITDLIVKNNPADIDALKNLDFNGMKLGDKLTEMVARIGENIGIRRFIVKNYGGAVKANHYVHAGSKIGVVVLFDDPNNKLTTEAGRDVAMHVAAMNPQFVRKSDISEAFLAKEKEVFLAQMANEKKPAEMMEKIVTGKLNKYLSEICLEDQIFIRDAAGKETVSGMLKKLDGSIKIKEITRFQVGEGIEKKKEE